MRVVIHKSSVNRFVTVGSVRYGLRLGAVSPPPPGAGPRYRSQCCWPSSLSAGPGPRVPLLSASSINSPDIFKCVNRLRMAEDATSELGEHSSGRDQVLHSTKTLLKSQLRRRALVRPLDYSRLWEGDGVDIADTLDRLPRFRFGGNRGNSKVRERDKRNNEQRLREQKKQPVPPPRVKHVSPRDRKQGTMCRNVLYHFAVRRFRRSITRRMTTNTLGGGSRCLLMPMIPSRVALALYRD